MMKVCQYSECTRTAQFFMGWENKNGKHYGTVCATHDKMLGRLNLTKVGMPLEEAIAFERYCRLTVNDTNPLDWPEWFTQQTGKTPTYTMPKKTPQSSDLVTLLSLSPRAHNTLRRNGITTIKGLASTSDYDLSQMRMLGTKSILEIHRQLKELGYE